MKPIDPARRRRLFIGAASVLGAGAIVVAALTASNPAKAKIFASEVKLPQLAEQLAETYCEALKQCDGKTELDLRWGYGGFEKNCKSVWTTRLIEETFAGMTSSAAAGTLEYDGRGAAQCVADMKKLGCSMFDHSLFSVCSSTFIGKASGQCKYSYECEEGMRCEVGSSCPGSCVPKSAANQPCRSSTDCRDGMFCSEVSQLCALLKAEGEGCTAKDGEFQCIEGLSCAGGKCVKHDSLYTKNAGETCDESSRCKPGLACALGAEKNECKALAKAGEACAEAFPSQCEAGLYCSADAFKRKWEGKCESSKAGGGACQADKECTVGLACRASACKKLAVVGERCSTNEDCVAGSCNRGSCAEPDVCAKDKK